MSVIVTQFMTLPGIASDPDGSAGTPGGGWASADRAGAAVLTRYGRAAS